VNSQEQTRQYLETLFHDLADNEQINIRPYIPEGYQAEGFINFFLDSIDEAVYACLLLREKKAHAYVSINPRDQEMVEAEEGKGKEGYPGGKSTVSRVITLFSDYDYVKMGQSRDQALEYLRSLPCPPSMIVDSGGGLQVYWLLSAPVTSTEDKAFAEKIMAGMCEWWQTDKVKDYSRILRVPGTLNVKPEYETPRECFIEQTDNGRRYSLNEVWAMVPEEYRSPQYSSRSSSSHSGKGAGEEHRNGGDPLASPEVPLTADSARHTTALEVIGSLCSLRTPKGDLIPFEKVKLLGELWFENPNNCSTPLHLSENPKEIKEWDRLVSDIYNKEQEKMKAKASENGHGSTGAAAAAVMEHVGARSVEDLLKREFPPIKWAIPDIVPEGVTLLSAREKTGKSWLVLGWLLAVATGGKALGCKQVEQGAVLYLALEDSERRLKERIKGVLKGRNPDLSGFEYATQWEKADEGGAESLDAWLTDHPHTRLVVIDVLKMWRAKTNTRDGIYDVDYESVAELVTLSKKHNVSIVIVHHNNKQVKPEDPFDNISGSTGLLGAVDAIIVMQRERGKDVASYWITGKDIEATSRHAMTWKPGILSWILEGDAEKYFETEERLEIEELLEADKELWTPKDIAAALDKNPATVRWLLPKMTQSETSRVVKHSYGKYCHTSSPHHKGDELLVSPTHPTNSLEEDRESLSEELDDPTNSTNSTNSPLDKFDTGGGTTNSHSTSANSSSPTTNSSETDPDGESPRVGGVGGVGSAEKKPLSPLNNITRVEISEEELEQEMHAQRVWERENTNRKKRGGSR
jgi:hypothetical protein